MKFDDLEAKMRVFETAHDHCVLPGIYIVARIDGRGFTRLTKEVHKFQRPFDERFRDFMVETVRHLMDCGFHVLFGYTQSDEISLLFSLNENAFGRKVRKYNSVLAGEASAKFSLLLRDMGAFDCRISQLPTDDDVVDYFRWRQEDAHRNALSGYCYWLLRDEGMNARKATNSLLGKSNSEKNELLFSRGVNFNEFPAWQQRGTGLYWEAYEKEAKNPQTGESVTAKRRRLRVDFDLPLRDEYAQFIRNLIGAKDSEK